MSLSYISVLSARNEGWHKRLSSVHSRKSIATTVRGLSQRQLLHLLSGSPRTPTAFCSVRQVGERTIGRFHFRESSENLSPRRWRESFADDLRAFERQPGGGAQAGRR